MTSILLELEQLNKSWFGRGWMMLIGIVNVLQSFFHQNELRYFDLAFGVFLIVAGLYYWKLYQPRAVTFDDIGISGKLKLGTTINLKWEDVSKMESSLYLIFLFTKAGEIHAIDLTNLTFQQHKEIKPKIIELAKSKGIDVVAA